MNKNQWRKAYHLARLSTCINRRACVEEEAEVKAGAYTRSELGRLLVEEAPDDEREKAVWHNRLDEEEREAYGAYQAYLSRVFLEMLRVSLVKIDGKEASLDLVQSIRPDFHRIQAITELVLHIQRISRVNDSVKSV